MTVREVPLNKKYKLQDVISDLNSLTRTRTNMSGIYNSARICPYNNRACNLDTQGLSLDPEIEERLATLASTGGSYDEMQYLWVRISFKCKYFWFSNSSFPIYPI